MAFGEHIKQQCFKDYAQSKDNINSKGEKIQQRESFSLSYYAIFVFHIVSAKTNEE